MCIGPEFVITSQPLYIGSVYLKRFVLNYKWKKYSIISAKDIRLVLKPDYALGCFK